MNNEPEDPPIIKLQKLIDFVEGLLEANGLSGNFSEDDIIYMDPRNTPEDKWIDHSSITIPEAVEKYLDTYEKVTIEETNNIEIALERFYSIPTERWFISLDTICLPSIVEKNHDLKTNVIKPLRFLLLKKPESEE